MLKEQFLEYLQAYSQKNIDKISDMLAEDVTLRDWKISVSGKAAAINETVNNFSSAESIKIETLHAYESGHSVAGELKITVNGSEILYVVDVVSFDASRKIKSIRAYLGRPD